MHDELTHAATTATVSASLEPGAPSPRSSRSRSCLSDGIASLYRRCFPRHGDKLDILLPCAVHAHDALVARDTNALKRKLSESELGPDCTAESNICTPTDPHRTISLDFNGAWVQQPWQSRSLDDAVSITRALADNAVATIGGVLRRPQHTCDSESERTGGIFWTTLGLNATACIEALLTQLRRLLHAKVHGEAAVAGAADRVVILKDILNDEILLEALPRTFIDMLCFLFLPRGLNFRNLIWHGFMAPSEVPPQCVALCVAVEGTLVEVISKLVSCSPSSLTLPLCTQLSYPDEYWSCFSEISSLGACNDDNNYAGILDLIDSSLFVVVGREALVASAYQDLARGDCVSCLLKIIPCIEHGLRLVFCAVNGEFDYLFASEEKYFSTLDGFGQRSKHQLLLDLHVHAYVDKNITDVRRPNRLPELLGEGLYSLLIDIFFTSSGPGLRSIFAHGEYGPAYSRDLLLTPSGVAQGGNNRSCIQCMARVTMNLFTALMRHFDVRSSSVAVASLVAQIHDPTITIAENPRHDALKALIDARRAAALKVDRSHVVLYPVIDAACGAVASWRSVFHTLAILRRRLVALTELIESTRCALFMRKVRYTRMDPLSAGDDVVSVSVAIDTGDAGEIGELVISDSARRIRDILGCDLHRGAHNDVTTYSVVPSDGSLAQKAVSCIHTCKTNLTYLRDGCTHSATSDILRRLLEAVASTESFIAALGRRDCPDGGSAVQNNALQASVVDGPFPLSTSSSYVPCDIGSDIESRLSDVFSVFVPVADHYGASVQLVETVTDILEFVAGAAKALEVSVSNRVASTAERRQYLQHIACILPISVAVAALCQGALLAHFAFNYTTFAAAVDNNTKASSPNTLLSVPALLSTASALKAALGCSTSDHSAGEVLKGKKSAEQCCVQLTSALASKALRRVDSK